MIMKQYFNSIYIVIIYLLVDIVFNEIRFLYRLCLMFHDKKYTHISGEEQVNVIWIWTLLRTKMSRIFLMLVHNATVQIKIFHHPNWLVFPIVPKCLVLRWEVAKIYCKQSLICFDWVMIFLTRELLLIKTAI